MRQLKNAIRSTALTIAMASRPVAMAQAPGLPAVGATGIHLSSPSALGTGRFLSVIHLRNGFAAIHSDARDCCSTMKQDDGYQTPQEPPMMRRGSDSRNWFRSETYCSPWISCDSDSSSTCLIGGGPARLFAEQ